MNVEIGNEVAQFLFWEYVFQIFGIVSCSVQDNSSRLYQCKFHFHFLLVALRSFLKSVNNENKWKLLLDVRLEYTCKLEPRIIFMSSVSTFLPRPGPRHSYFFFMQIP